MAALANCDLLLWGPKTQGKTLGCRVGEGHNVPLPHKHSDALGVRAEENMSVFVEAGFNF